MGSPMPKNDINYDIKKKLFRFAMKSNWDDVINIYQSHPNVHMEKITKSEQTALHIAVSDVQEQKVAKLVDIIIKHPTKTDESTIADHHKTTASKIDKAEARFPALAVEDDRGNTPLHIAASVGSAKMCECIAWANKDSSLELIGARNHDGETPFFLAALHGHKDAFLRLHSIIISNPNGSGYEYCRKNDGDTILHAAISGDYFDLAFQIIHLYKRLANSVNEQGLTPLHILATKPSAFRSGSHLGRFNQIIYHCTFVERLKEVRVKPFQAPAESTLSADKKKFNFPENYQTCCSIISLLKKVVEVAICPRRKEAEPEAPPAGDTEDPQGNSKGIGGAQGHLFFPPNYKNCFEFVKLVSKAMLVILGLGSKRIKKTREKKEKHTWSVQIMNELLDASFDYEDDGTQPSPGSISEFSSIDLDQLLEKVPTPDHPGSIPPISSFSSDPNHNKDKENEKGKSKAEEGITSKKEPPAKSDLSEKVQNFLKKFPILATNTDEKVLLSVDNRKEYIHTGMTSKKETPILIAAKNGITEIVQKILEKYPVAIQDMNTDRKNMVLLAVENRQPHVYQLLLKITTMKESVFRKVDNKGNSALHLAATLGDHKPWLIPGAALQMQWELKWYEFVKDSMPFHFFVRYNKDNKTPKDIFTETHSDLVKAGGEWLTNTSESCSVVAALIATVAFATSATVPGGVKPDSGTPTLENQPAFNVFAISSLVALCFSVNAVIMFLSILTSRYQEKDFGEDLPRKLLIGLTSLFVSIASMLISFCAGHFFVLKDKLKFAALPVYAVTCLPVTFFAVAQFPLYFDLAWATFKKVPQRSYKSIPT